MFPHFHDGAPGPATPKQPPGHSPLKAAIDMDDATRLGSKAGGSPRSKFHTFFSVSVSQFWALGQPAGPSQALGAGGGSRANEAKARIGATFQQDQDPEPNVCLLSKSEMEERLGWAWEGGRNGLSRSLGTAGGSSHVRPLLLQPDPHSWDERRREATGQGRESFPHALNGLRVQNPHVWPPSSL